MSQKVILSVITRGLRARSTKVIRVLYSGLSSRARSESLVIWLPPRDSSSSVINGEFYPVLSNCYPIPYFRARSHPRRKPEEP